MNKKLKITVFLNFSVRLCDLLLNSAGKKRTFIRHTPSPHEEPCQTVTCELNPI